MNRKGGEEGGGRKEHGEWWTPENYDAINFFKRPTPC